MSRSTLTLAGALLLAAAAPAAAQQAMVIRGGTVHPLSGPEFTGNVVIENGQITAAGPDASAPSGATVIDASGLHVYPGLFDAATQLGLTEIGAVGVTDDIDELGDFTPHLQARTAVHPHSEHIPVARENGITHTMAVPYSGGGFRGGGAGFPGQGSVFSLDGWTIEEMEIEPGAAMAMSWPTIRTRTFGFGGGGGERPFREAKEEYDREVLRLGQWLDAARQYEAARNGGDNGEPDLRLEALARVTRGEIPILAFANSEREIRDVLDFARDQGIRVIIAGGREAYRVADLIAERDVPVILGPTLALPAGTNRPWDEAFQNPVRLHEAGVEIAFATFNSADSRTLPYEAVASVPYGLPHDVALRAVTIAPAEILGLDDRIGTIEPGKIANLIVTDGDPLEVTTNVEHLIIEGREASTDNRHRRLYETFRARPRPGGN